jgi:hypothetical protein
MLLEGFQSPLVFEVLFVVFLIVFISIFILFLASLLSPKLRGKMMSRQIKATKFMVEESKDNLKGLYSTTAGIGIAGKKAILDQNADELRDIAMREADIASAGIETRARSVKRGLTQEDSIYCKHCGTAIDSDSRFCKECGKGQGQP